MEILARRQNNFTAIQKKLDEVETMETKCKKPWV
jgi:hypothetical protein